MKKKIILSLSFLVLSIFISSIFKVRLDSTFVNTLYTVSGIMFSIGMGVICTFNPDKIKNRNFFKLVKDNIIRVRNSYLLFFGLISASYLIYLLDPNFEYSIILYKTINITFTMSIFILCQSILTITFFIVNFLEIQKLNFDIADRLNH